MKKSLFAYLIFANDPISSKESKNNPNEHAQKEFLNKFKDCFSSSIPNELPPSRGEDDHKIDLIPGSSPPNRPPYRVSHAQQEEILTQVNELLGKGMIHTSSSPFCSPV